PLGYRGVPTITNLAWYVRYGHQVRPASENIALRVAYSVPFVAQTVVGLFILSFWPPATTVAPFGFPTGAWIPTSVFGVVGGCIWLLLYASILFAVRPSRTRLASHSVLRQPIRFIVPLSVSSALIEEIWRACCLIALRSSSPTHAVGLTAVAC